MKRHGSLEDLSRDHYHALIHAKRLREAAGEGAAREAAGAFLAFWERDARHHFREEEEVLLPVLSRHGAVSEDAAVRRVLDDHAWLRDRVRALAARVEAGERVGPLARAVGERLTAHVRLEERELFERLQGVLSEADLEDVAERSVAFRLEWRGERAVGPPGSCDA